MRFEQGVSRRAFLVGAAALGAATGAATPAPARPVVEEAVLTLRDYRVVRARRRDGRPGAPVLLWLPVVSGPCAPIHLGFARRLAAAGYHVLTPELPERGAPVERARDIAEILLLAADEGASRTAVGVIGYDGGAHAARLALSTEPRIRAGVVYPGPLAANPVSRPASGAGGGASHPRLLEHPGCTDLEMAAAALDGGLAWLAAHGTARLS